MIKKVVLALSLLLTAAAPAAAQFADQATYAGAGGGTANAQTLTLANASAYADLVGVIVKYVPSATNTGAATLNVNSFGSSPSFRKPNGAGVTALVGGEIVSGQPTFVMYDGTYFNLVAPVGLPVGAASLQSSAAQFGVPVNFALSGSVGSNQLTISILGNDGNAPSSTNPVIIPFRNSTISTGTPVIRTITSSLSFTIASGSTMGCVSGQMCRLWIVAIDNGGTAALCAFNALSGTNIAPINEAVLQSSASGTSGGNSAQTYYCSTSSVTSKAIRIIGYIDISQVTAGTWATGPTYVQLFGPGIKKPGDIVQTLTTPNGSLITSTNTYMPTDTPPAPSNGVLVASQAITPTSAANIVDVQAQVLVGNTAQSNLQTFGYVTQDAGTTPLATSSQATNVGSTNPTTIPLRVRTVTNSTSSITFKLYGADHTGTMNINGAGGARNYGGTANSYITVNEIMSSLPTPANDDGSLDRRMVG